MKSIPTALKAQIDDGNICTVFKVEANDGSIVYLTDHNLAITVEGNVYQPSAGVTRLKMKATNNAEVSNQEVAATILDLPENELKSGKWDNAKIEVAMVGWKNPSAGKLVVFKGAIGVIQWTDVGFRADIQNYLRNLQRNIGSNVTAQCRHQLYSTAEPGRIGFCGVNKATFTTTGTINYVLTQKLKFKLDTTSKPDGWASAGFVRFTSGNNAGLSFEVKIHKVEGGAIGESIELFIPTLGSVAVGDTIELSAGCDHLLETCKTKFNNTVNYGGFPHLQVDVNSRVEGG